MTCDVIFPGLEMLGTESDLVHSCTINRGVEVRTHFMTCRAYDI